MSAARLSAEGNHIASGPRRVGGLKIGANRLCGALEAPKEGFGGHRSEEPEGRVAKVKESIPVLEQDRLLRTQLSSFGTRRHTHSPDRSIRQLDSGTSEGSLSKTVTKVSFVHSSKTNSVRRDPLNLVFAEKWAQLLANRLRAKVIA